MEYKDILKIIDIEEKNKKLIEFYIQDINVLNWLTDKTKIQKILFKDRIEHKFNGKYHKLTGPAIEYLNKLGTPSGEGEFYINGQSYNKVEWKEISTQLLREEKFKRIL